jgi:hypothetical protein
MNAEDLEREYQQRLATHPDACWGWSFMYTPEKFLDHAKIVLVGLNPAGRQTDEANRSWEHTGVNAYVEPWDEGKDLNRLQRQVGLLFEALGVQPTEVFAANFVPFRSPSWRELPNQKSALIFGRKMWTELLARTSARLFVSLGKQSGQELATLLSASLRESHDVELKPQTIDEYVALDGRTVLALPHLSRFSIFGGQRTSAASISSKVAQRVYP